MKNRYNSNLSEESINKDVAAAAVLEKDFAEGPARVQALKKCFACLDLTTLHTEDTASSVREFVKSVGTELLPASVCVFSNFASTVRESRPSPALKVTVVSACFPTSQSFPEVKKLECEMAVRNGADEVDIVLDLGKFCDSEGGRAEAFDEIAALRKAIDAEAAAQGRKVTLKVILETGVLKSVDLIAEASFLAMEAGADFIKTSTGKVSVNATPEAACTMCRCIKAFYEKTGRRIGFKAAGGISTTDDAIRYYCIVRHILGEEWLDSRYFRIGASKLADNIKKEI